MKNTSFKMQFSRIGLYLMLGLLLSLSACDALDFPDPNAPDPDVVTTQSIVTGTLGLIRAEHGIFLRVTGILGREAYYFEAADPRYVGELYTGPLDPGGFLLTRPWNTRYRAIANASILLEKATEVGGAEGSGIEGFAETVIASQLLQNLVYLDEEGIKIVFSEDIETPFASKADALTEIARRLDAGNTALSAAGDEFSFSLANGFDGFNTPATFAQFNRALRARVAIYQADYAAATAALTASFIDDAGDMLTGPQYNYGTGSGDRANPMYEVPTGGAVKLRAHPDFLTNADTSALGELDLRYASKVLDRTTDTTFVAAPPAGGGLSSALVATVATGSAGTLPIIRNEELILLRAEVAIMAGDFAGAVADLNIVRAAAGLEPIAAAADEASAIDQLLNERRYSLFLEGHRWADMRRFGKLADLPNDRASDLIFSNMPKPQDEVDN